MSTLQLRDYKHLSVNDIQDLHAYYSTKWWGKAKEFDYIERLECRLDNLYELGEDWLDTI